mmetsp:Transcript_36365/g.71574  ORF Transcript_36365/g.71574 Transcript_36365/m.71574 type:complete len:218 (-) Transcript_36365:2667-3320(-)
MFRSACVPSFRTFGSASDRTGSTTAEISVESSLKADFKRCHPSSPPPLEESTSHDSVRARPSFESFSTEPDCSGWRSVLLSREDTSDASACRARNTPSALAAAARAFTSSSFAVTTGSRLPLTFSCAVFDSFTLSPRPLRTSAKATRVAARISGTVWDATCAQTSLTRGSDLVPARGQRDASAEAPFSLTASAVSPRLFTNVVWSWGRKGFMFAPPL